MIGNSLELQMWFRSYMRLTCRIVSLELGPMSKCLNVIEYQEGNSPSFIGQSDKFTSQVWASYVSKSYILLPSSALTITQLSIPRCIIVLTTVRRFGWVTAPI